MDKMRDGFEAWCDEQGYASDKYSADDCGDKYKHLVGVYVISDTRLLWEAWEASRAAICVELPMSLGYPNSDMVYLSDVEDRMETAGVLYK